MRTAVPDDEDGVARISASATAALRQIYRPNQKALEHRSQISRRLQRLVAIYQGRLAGMAQCYADGDAMHIVELAVDSDFRRRGVARALVSRITELARERGLACIVTRTVVQTGNVSVFKALGFEVLSEYPDEYSENEEGMELTEAELRMSI